MDKIDQLVNNLLQYKTYIFIGITVFALILFILIIVLLIKNSAIKKRLNKFMEGSNGLSLEEAINKRFIEIDKLIEENKSLNKSIDLINENLNLTYQKLAVVKYDAFQEMGGKLSFVATLLDKNNNGIMINSVYSTREGCYVYLKEIIKGESFVELSKEESESLEKALDKII